MIYHVFPGPVRIGDDVPGALDGPADLLIVAGALGGEKLGKVDEIQVMDRDDRAKMPIKGGGSASRVPPVARDWVTAKAVLCDCERPIARERTANGPAPVSVVECIARYQPVDNRLAGHQTRCA